MPCSCPGKSPDPMQPRIMVHRCSHGPCAALLLRVRPSCRDVPPLTPEDFPRSENFAHPASFEGDGPHMHVGPELSSEVAAWLIGHMALDATIQRLSRTSAAGLGQSRTSTCLESERFLQTGWLQLLNGPLQPFLVWSARKLHAYRC